MKRTTFITGILSVAAFLLLAGCTDSVSISSSYSVALKAYYIHPTRTEFAFNSASAGTTQFDVNATDSPWAFIEFPDWVSISPSTGSTTTSVSLSVSENPDATSRMNLFHLTSTSSEWAYSTPITVTQGAAEPYAYPSQTSCDLSAGGGTYNIAVRTNAGLSYNCSADWIQLELTTDGVAIIAEENFSSEPRSTYVTISAAGHSDVIATISINQQAPNVSITTDPLSFDVYGGSYRLSFTSDVSWRLSTAQDWISAALENGSTQGGAGTFEFFVEASPNTGTETRTGYVYLDLGSAIRVAEIPVTQGGIVLQLKDGVTKVEVSALSASTVIEIESNIGWSTSGWPSWAHPNITEGNGNASITLTCDENTEAESRAQSIRITPSIAGAYPVDFVLRQRNFTFHQDQTYLECSDLSQTLTYQIQTDASWSTGVEEAANSWLSVSPYSGSGFYDVSVTVQENTSPDSRSGQVFTYALGNAYPVNVTQLGWEDKWHVIQEMMEVKAAGGSVEISISTNDRWYAVLEEEQDWISLTGGETTVGNGTLTLSFQENMSVNNRGVNLLICFEHDEYVVVPVRQAGRKIYLNCSSLFFFAKGGAATVIVTPDGSFSSEVTAGNDWLTLEQGENNTFTVNAAANETGSIREGIIRMALTDLPNESESYALDVHVTQTTVEAGFSRTGWDDYEDMNLYTDIGITITGFRGGAFDSTEAYTGAITITGFDATSNWNNPSWTPSITISDFLDDVDLSHFTENTGIDGEGYDDTDEDWN